MKKIFLALVVWLALISSAYPQHTVTGTVVSITDSQPIPGVSVVEKGVNNGTVTDANGNYSITVQSGNAVLVYSFVWMENKEVSIDGRSKINISMITREVDVDDVVTTALGIPLEKKSLGYAVTGLGSNYFSIVKETNPVNSLAGRIAGVNITPGSFGPGSNSCVIFRGRSSLTGSNEPLYVVDGVPMDQSGVFSLVDYDSGMADINPDDIASISVLKGPNAAALYGSRAANGVIMITTKQGSARKGIGVSFSSNTTFESPMLLPQYQNQYGQGSEGAIPSTVDLLKSSGGSWGPEMDGSSQLYYTGENRPYSPQADNIKDFFDTGSTFINTIALTGGNEKVKMRFSFTNTSKNLTIPNSRVDKNYFNLRSSARLTNKLTIDARATYLKQYDKNFQGSGPEGLMSSLFNIPRNVDINDYKNYQEPTTFSSVGATTQNSNPYWTTFHDRYDARKDRFLGFVKVRYDIASWLSAYARIGTDATNMNIETVNQYGNWNYPTGKFNYLESQIQETNADFLFLAKKGLTPRISLSAAIGGNAMQQSFRGHEISGEDFLVPEAAPFLSASVLHPGFDPLEKKKINSLYGTASLSFNYWLYLDVSARNDWSSTLPENGWSYLYPAISTSILLNNLLELNNSIMNYSKVRLSWAKTGNATPPFQLYNTYGASGISGSYLGEITMSRDSIKMNPSLKPEQVSSLEVGCELHFFDNRLYTDVSYYDMKSKNLSLDVPVSPSTGYKLMRENTGEIRNRGVEVTLGAVPVRNRKLTWDIAMNFAMNKNKVSQLAPGVDRYVFSEADNGDVIVAATVGGGIGDIYGTTMSRTDDGRLIVNADGLPQVSHKKIYLGSYQPKWIGGVSNTLTYRDLRLNLLIDGECGGKVYSGLDAQMDAAGTSKRTLQYRDGGVVVDGVVNTGTVENPVWATNNMPVAAQQYWETVSGIASEYVYDRTNVRLREFSLIWNVPVQMLNNSLVKGASLGLIGRNLFFLYKKVDNFDPESIYTSSSCSQGLVFYPLPTTRSLGFYLNLKF